MPAEQPSVENVSSHNCKTTVVEKNEIKIRTRNREVVARISVSDSGMGIPDPIQSPDFPCAVRQPFV